MLGVQSALEDLPRWQMRVLADVHGESALAVDVAATLKDRVAILVMLGVGAFLLWVADGSQILWEL